MISLEQVSYAYEGNETTPALRKLNLNIQPGELVVLDGTSGCGKTTVLRLINGLIPDCFHGELTGEIRVCGKNPQEEKAVGMSHCVSSVFQNPKSQFFNINSRNELAFPLENRAVPKAEIVRRMEDTAKKLHMDHLVDWNMFHLSGGEKQKIVFASVSMTDNEVLVLDEPSSNLDMEAVRDLRTILKSWKQEGKTILISEHRFFFLGDLMDRLVIIDRGEVAASYNREQLWRLSPQQLHRFGLRGLDLVELPERKDTVKPCDTMLDIEALQFRYPESDHGIEIARQNFSAGHVVGIIGHNGAGKSTFLRCLCGLQRHVKGDLRLKGKSLSPKKLLSHCSMVMQDVNHQLFSDSVAHELVSELKRRKIPKSDQQTILQDWLLRTELLAVQEQHPMSISGGQKRRLAIAAAALFDKEIILFDEPTSGLDYLHMQQVSQMIRELADAGKLIFLVSHDLDLLLQVCDDVAVLENGQIVDRYPLNADTQHRLTDWFSDLVSEK